MEVAPFPISSCPTGLSLYKKQTHQSGGTADLDICAYNSYMDFDRCQKYTSEERQNFNKRKTGYMQVEK